MKTGIVSLIVGVLVALSNQSIAAEDKKCAMVLIHGKWRDPGDWRVFARSLGPMCALKAIEMPWSGRRSYDKSYPEALDEIAKEVELFRSQGYKNVILVGYSFGVNAGLAYMATKGDADAVLGLAPGHSPQVMYQRGMNKDVVSKARELIKDNKGQEKVSFVDLNQTFHRSFSVPAVTFLSYFDPEGLGVMAVSAKRFQRSVPVMIVIGTRDPLINSTKSDIFPSLPDNPQNRLIVVEADHGGTEALAIPFAIEWVKGLK